MARTHKCKNCDMPIVWDAKYQMYKHSMTSDIRCRITFAEPKDS